MKKTFLVTIIIFTITSCSNTNTDSHFSGLHLGMHKKEVSKIIDSLKLEQYFDTYRYSYDFDMQDHTISSTFGFNFEFDELIKIDEKMKSLIHKGASEQKLELLALKSAVSIRQDGIIKMCQGITTADEILRVT